MLWLARAGPGDAAGAGSLGQDGVPGALDGSRAVTEHPPALGGVFLVRFRSVWDSFGAF